MDPFESMLLYAGDRLHSREELHSALSQGAVVVLNRYVPSNIAYGCAKLILLDREFERNRLIEINEQLEYELLGLPRPDKVIVLDVRSSVASDMVVTKAPRQYLEGQKKDQYESNHSLQYLVREQYLWLAQQYPEWHVVECTLNDNSGPRSIEAIQADIRRLLYVCVGGRELKTLARSNTIS